MAFHIVDKSTLIAVNIVETRSLNSRNFKAALVTKVIIKFINHVLIAFHTFDVIVLIVFHVLEECSLIRLSHET